MLTLHLDSKAAAQIAPINARLQHHLAYNMAIVQPLAETLVAMDVIPTLQAILMSNSMKGMMYNEWVERALPQIQHEVVADLAFHSAQAEICVGQYFVGQP